MPRRIYIRSVYAELFNFTRESIVPDVARVRGIRDRSAGLSDTRKYVGKSAQTGRTDIRVAADAIILRNGAQNGTYLSGGH